MSKSGDDSWPGQMLHQAAIYNNVELLVCLLHGDEIAYVNATDICGRTALYTAVSNGSTKCLKVLLDHGADANIPAGPRCHNMTPLHEAVLNSKVEALSILLDCGADLSSLDDSGKTPLSLAKYIKNREAFGIIDKEKQKRKCVMEQLSRDLCGACALGDYKKVEKLLQSCGPYRRHVINMATKGLSPLAIASKCGYADILCLLLAESTQCTAQRDTGLTLLHLACESGHREVIDILQQSFPELINLRSIEHQLPLHVAVIHNRLEAVKALLNFPYSEQLSFEDASSDVNYLCGLELNGRDSSGETPLHIACRHNFVDIIKVLVSFSVQVEVKKKSIPRSTSLRSRTFDLEKQVEDDGDISRSNSMEFDSSSTDISPDDPLHSKLKPSLMMFHPVDINCPNIEGLTPFHMAIRYGCTEAVQIMLSCRPLPPSTVRTKDKEYSVLMYAYDCSNLEILKLLLSYGFVDVDNKVLSSTFFSKDQESECLLLTHKSSKDPAHNINKIEMKKVAYQLSHSPDNTSTLEPEYRVKYPNTAVAINWNNIGMLNEIEPICLTNACRLHNPLLHPSLESSIILCAITKVDISKNSFRKFPSILLRLPSLVLLKASRNEIAEIPDYCEVLCVSLEELHLNENRLVSLPKFVFQFPTLKYLDISVNRLTEMPADMWAAVSLIYLNISNNRLTSLPTMPLDHPIHRLSSSSSAVKFRKASMGSYRKDVTNSFSESISSVEGDNSTNYISDTSKDSVVDFTVLSMQEVTTNSIIRINKWSMCISVVDRDPWKGSSQSSGLKQLWLSRNKLSQVPSGLSCCAPSLEFLDISENPLISPGNIMDYPASLVELSLSKTGLTSLDSWRLSIDGPQDIACHGLHQSSPGNGQGSLASSYNKNSSSFSSLREFYAAACCPHRSHTCLTKLEKLNLSSNNLSSVCLARDPHKDNKQADAFSVCSMESEEIQGRLLFPILSELNLSGNKLFSLPPEIGELSCLKILSLRRNPKLRELPPKLGLLKNLWKLDLEFCPLDGTIQDFLHNSRFPVKDILGFLQSVLEESTEYNCMNLMLVGFHKIGKTSLLQRLCEKGKMIHKSTHWRDRVNKDNGGKGQTTLLSTVGIDINQLVLEKKTKGPVVFRTWDFGGQREYYATHQYFLSPRSLYLVVWSIIDGERGVESLLLWLVNIQARAPGASVIIVGTHLDILRDKATRGNFPGDFEESMMLLIEKMFLSNQEPDKSGLPNILMAINVSCKTGENIKRLVDAIYECVFDLKHPKSRTQFLVNQKIPRKYLLLQNIIRELAEERVKDSKEPVLNRSKYTLCVQNKMMENGMTFRDVEELEQATRFLHENGVLFHYDDLPLNNLFFLDPQWLCDQLAKVITVKEINNFAQRGVMKLNSLEFLFKSATFQPKHIKTYITSLLSKFEVALQFDEEHLLLPSLLPTEIELLEMARRKSDVRIPLRKPADSQSSDKRYEGIRSRRSGRRLPEQTPSVLHVGTSVFYTGSQVIPDLVAKATMKDSPNLSLLAIKPTSSPILSNCRLYFMTYFPSGFWPRLITRILADESLYPIAKKLFDLPAELKHRSREVQYLYEKDPEWRCWQTGLELFFMGFEMMRVREVVFSTSSYFCDYSQCRIKCSIDSEWAFLDVINSKILEITFPTDSLRFHVASNDGPPLQNLDFSKPSAIIYREEMVTTQMLVKIIEHVDNLLQDWYPDLGELRFNQNCEGRYLVTRIIPCPQCLNKEVTNQRLSKQDSWFLLNPEVPDICTPVVITQERQRSKTCVESSSPADLFMDDIPESMENFESRQRSLTEGQALIYNRSTPDSEAVIYSWLVERCMLDVLEGVNSVCPYHGSVSPLFLLGRDGTTQQLCIAQDVVFNDLSQSLLLPSSSQLDIGEYLGKGNFGEVHKGSLYYEDGNPPEDVAVKILFRKAATRKDISRGFQNYLEQACTAYLTVRQEVSILSRLDHPNIVPLIALCLQPLSLVLMLAPLGALDVRLKLLNERGELLPFYTVRQIIIQVAKALSYLHSNHIIYRDLKSENVLIWELPSSSESHPTDTVDVKLADYGISRSVLPTGTRGFGGTPPFIAPEILQHAGKGTYTEKVDVFSFGMFLYEVLTCRVPFATVNNPSNLVCQGERPSLTVQEAERSPSYILDLMTLCWSQDPDQRPTMEAIQRISTSPQFCHLQDVVTLGPDVAIYAGCSLSFTNNSSGTPGAVASPASLEQQSFNSTSGHSLSSQVWLSSGFHGNSAIEILTFNQSNRVENYRTMDLTGFPIVSMCVVDGIVWCADSQGTIQMFHCGSLGLVHEMKLTKHEDASCTIISLHPSPGGMFVLAVASEGFIYQIEQSVYGLPQDERNIVTHKVEPCFCSVLVQGLRGHEVWLGHSHGSISVWNIPSKCVDRQISHGPKLATSSSNCAFLVTQSGVSKDMSYVWSYNYPGAVICMWNVNKSYIEKRLDCSQIVSTVESPVMPPSKHFECGQVTALSAIDNYLYIGTTRGCILVTELLTLAPLCVFQCHTTRDFFVKTILPILPMSLDMDIVGTPLENKTGNPGVGLNEEEEDENDKRQVVSPAVVTVGMGYSNIIKTFHPDMDASPKGRLDDIGPNVEPAHITDQYTTHTFMLTWIASDWEFY